MKEKRKVCEDVTVGFRKNQCQDDVRLGATEKREKNEL